MSYEITTKRLSLRPVEVEDSEALHALWTNERVRQFLWDGEVIPLEQTRQIVHKSTGLFHEAGFGIGGIRMIGEDQLLGFSGYWHFRTPPSLELLFGVGPGDWDRGIATEASQQVIRYGFEKLGFQKIDASTDLENVASIRVLENLGLRFDRRETVDGLETLFYGLTVHDWASKTQPGVPLESFEKPGDATKR